MKSIVARSVGDHQLGLEAQLVDPFNGVFDALALYHAGGLEVQHFVRGYAQGLPDVRPFLRFQGNAVRTRQPVETMPTRWMFQSF